VDVWADPAQGGDPRLFRLEVLNHLDGIVPPFFVRIYEMRPVVQDAPAWVLHPTTPGEDTTEEALQAALREIVRHVNGA
jgi:hypothetical protein